MKYLVDPNLSPRVAQALSSAGFDAVHVRDVGLLTASDQQISEDASTIISVDSDFARLLALRGAYAPSLGLLRSADALDPTEQARMLIANLPTLEEHLAAGSVVSLSPGRVPGPPVAPALSPERTRRSTSVSTLRRFDAALARVGFDRRSLRSLAQPTGAAQARATSGSTSGWA